VLASFAKVWHSLSSFAIGDWSVPDEILTLPEVAILLKVAEKTVNTMAQKAHLPAFKVGGQWRFKRIDIDEWIEQQKGVSASEKGS
jgi:excisionase family DNA binding protein